MTKKELKNQTAKEPKKAAVETKIYIGKSLPGLPQYTVFKGGHLSPYVEEMAAQNEAIAGLIVPVSDLQEARKNIRIKGHILNQYFKQQSIKENKNGI